MKTTQVAAFAAACMALAASFLASAQAMPRFDVEAHCEEVSQTVGGSHQIYNSCIQMEQRSYNSLKADWSGVSSQIRNHCHEVAETVGGSYQIMESCVQMEQDAAGNRESFSFD
ncbi:MAG: hypothetical protein ACQER5_05575 [Pseudomonadota bacterium]